MTRGISRQQWQIIEAVGKGHTTIEYISCYLLRMKLRTPKDDDLPRHPTEKEKISVRRSILNLEKKGYMKSHMKGQYKIIKQPS